ncbi:MAG: DUF4249 domain-containing protein [Cytophagales bacterium]|nr:DUF4249 domain-containing protein [Cytophagales bacterium]
MVRHLKLGIIAGLFVLTTCIDPVEFDTSSEPSRLVVQGYISDVPAKNRETGGDESPYFKVKLSLSSPVSNIRDHPIKDATVMLLDDQENQQELTPSFDGEYFLYDEDFKAVEGRSYFIRISTADGNVYESQPQRLQKSLPTGPAKYRIDSRLNLVEISDQSEVVTLEGISVYVDLPQNSSQEPVYYLWELVPAWIFKASLLPDGHPNKTCWVTNIYYLDEVVIHQDKFGQGSYPKELFFLEAETNTRLQYDFSVLIRQFSLNKETFEFWEDIKKQNERVGSIFDPPPFSIRGNLFNVNYPDDRVLGYFSVVGESTQRWFTNIRELPYRLPNIDPCRSPPGVPNIPSPDCLDCFRYRGGSSYIINVEPSWWR